MSNRRAEVVVGYPGQPMIVASVATTPSMVVVSLGEGREEHLTYPPDGRFHLTPHNRASARSYFEPGPAYEGLSYHPLARVDVPTDPTQLARPYRSSPSRASMSIPAPTARAGVLEVGILGQQATPAVVQALRADGATVQCFEGPRSDTTVVFRHLS